MGLGNSGDIGFSLFQSLGMRRHFYGQSPAQILADKCEITQPIWAWNQKPHAFTALWGRFRGQDLAPRPHNVAESYK